ncbi:MAG: SDH family Clp fold serine proteinase, partial [Microbacteriaceae bacterium]
MGTWNRLRTEFEAATQASPEGTDRTRRKYLKAYEDFAGRPLVFYGTPFEMGNRRFEAGDLSVTPYDKDGWVEATESLPAGPLDVMLHSPGGSPATAEWVVEFLRQKFGPIRAIVPHSAKSAATMIALGCDEIVIDERGELGPIDPQMVLGRLSPAQAVLDQFDKAQAELTSDPKKMAVWAPILQQIGPSLLAECEKAIELSKSLVTLWLEKYMFKNEADPGASA